MAGRKRYCCIHSCEHFNGTLDKNIHMFRLDFGKFYISNIFFNPIPNIINYRFPTEAREIELWHTAINTNNEKRSSNNSICKLHFQSIDIVKVRGQLKLKKNAVPMFFVCQIDEKSDDEIDSSPNRQTNKCIDCDAFNEQLNQMRAEHERELLKLRLNNEIVQYKKNDDIDKLRGKLDSLKERVAVSEKLNRQYEVEIEKIRDKMLCWNDASNVKVRLLH